MAAKDEPGRRTPRASRSGVWHALLLIPVATPALTIALPLSQPRLLGIPLFYVLHLAICLLSAAVTCLVQRLVKDP